MRHHQPHEHDRPARRGRRPAEQRDRENGGGPDHARPGAERASRRVPDDSKQQILALAPSLAFTTANVSLRQPIQRYADLATALGADVAAKPITDAKTRFEQASDALHTAATKGLRVLAASAAADLLYISDPRAYPDLSYFRELGVEFVVPTNVTGGFFENLSWENADKYPADVILLDNRAAALQPLDLTTKPTWSRLPAVRAGQILPWPSEPRFSYAGCAPFISSLANTLHRATQVS